MLRYLNKKDINRILDANINRAKEGLRVCEEVARFTLNNQRLTSELKKIRHEIASIVESPGCLADLLKSRKSLQGQDIGRDIYIDELKRKNIQDIFFANIQRAKESIRVLEEFSKLNNKELAIKFKNLRYTIYEIEKRAAKRILALCNH